MKLVTSVIAIAVLLTFGLAAEPQPPPPSVAAAALHAKQPRRLVIKNAMVIYGNAKPPYGPVDIVVQDGLISYIGTTTDVPTSANRFQSATRTVRVCDGRLTIDAIGGTNTKINYVEVAPVTFGP